MDGKVNGAAQRTNSRAPQVVAPDLAQSIGRVDPPAGRRQIPHTRTGAGTLALKHNYSGYTSYEYVRSHRDFTEYDLIEGESLFEPYLVPLNASQEARMLDLAGRILMISLHEHPHLFPAKADQIRAYDSEGRVHTAYEALADSWWDCVFDNFLDGAACITSKNGWKWDDVIYDMGMRFCDLAHQDFIIKCEVVDDIHRAHREGADRVGGGPGRRRHDRERTRPDRDPVRDRSARPGDHIQRVQRAGDGPQGDEGRRTDLVRAQGGDAHERRRPGDRLRARQRPDDAGHGRGQPASDLPHPHRRPRALEHQAAGSRQRHPRGGGQGRGDRDRGRAPHHRLAATCATASSPSWTTSST